MVWVRWFWANADPNLYRRHQRPGFAGLRHHLPVPFRRGAGAQAGQAPPLGRVAAVRRVQRPAGSCQN